MLTEKAGRTDDFVCIRQCKGQNRTLSLWLRVNRVDNRVVEPADNHAQPWRDPLRNIDRIDVTGDLPVTQSIYKQPPSRYTSGVSSHPTGELS